MNWLRRLLGPPPQRGTLTFLAHGEVVVGFPSDREPTPEEAERLRARLREWLADLANGGSQPLVLPFPVDVTDRRTK